MLFLDAEISMFFVPVLKLIFTLEEEIKVNTFWDKVNVKRMFFTIWVGS